MWNANDGMGWWMVFMGVFWVLFWGSLVFLAIAAIARSGWGGSGRERDSDSASAIEIARRRLARGEITPDQFQEIRRHLEAGPPQPT